MLIESQSQDSSSCCIVIHANPLKEKHSQHSWYKADKRDEAMANTR